MCISVFFFKQKTAYEMRISDWSSDVCSSDLDAAGHQARIAGWPCTTMPDTITASFTLKLEGRLLDFAVAVPSRPIMLRELLPSLFEFNRQLLDHRSEEHTSELQSPMRISYAVLCWKKKTLHAHTNLQFKLHTSHF